MMAGLLLALVSAVAGPSLPGRRTSVAVASSGLIAAGLFCGVALIAVTAPGSRRSRSHARRQAPAPPRQREPDPTEEWMDALRPPGPPPATSPAPASEHDS
jgi:hypothetical protein